MKTWYNSTFHCNNPIIENKGEDDENQETIYYDIVAAKKVNDNDENNPLVVQVNLCLLKSLAGAWKQKISEGLGDDTIIDEVIISEEFKKDYLGLPRPENLEGVIGGLEVDRTEVADMMLSHLTAFREVLDDINDQQTIDEVRSKVLELTARFPVYS